MATMVSQPIFHLLTRDSGSRRWSSSIKVDHVPASVNVNCLAPHQPNFKAGSEVTEPTVPIPLESFRFRNHSEMLGLANSNNQLPGNASLTTSSDNGIGYLIVFVIDLIGEITAVKTTVTDSPRDKNRVMATIKMEK
ncbi:Rep_fac-A_C domain-containing protein [Raphanus sativus]|nr:Rep_fac-A_C domain-containing protein [Raphanus sativus]